MKLDKTLAMPAALVVVAAAILVLITVFTDEPAPAATPAASPTTQSGQYQ